MGSRRPLDVDVTLADPASIVYVVADLLAGHSVELAWATITAPTETTANLAVQTGVVEVIGCVAAPGEPVTLQCLTDPDGDFAEVAWADLLAVGHRVGCVASYPHRRQTVEVSRWYGHTVDIGTVNGERFVGTVIGFQAGDEVDVILTRADHVRYPLDPPLDEVAVPFDCLEEILEWRADT